MAASLGKEGKEGLNLYSAASLCVSAASISAAFCSTSWTI
jgi:hypothetical protein